MIGKTDDGDASRGELAAHDALVIHTGGHGGRMESYKSIEEVRRMEGRDLKTGRGSRRCEMRCPSLVQACGELTDDLGTSTTRREER